MSSAESWKMTVIEHGYFLDVGRGQSLYGAHNQKTADKSADQPANLTVIQGCGHNILVDTGFGNPAFIKKYNAGYMLTPEEYLDAVGLRPYDIDTIMISHMHYDHVGFINSFPQATVYVQKSEYEGWKKAIKLSSRYALLLCYLDENTMDDFEKIDKEGRLVLAQDGDEIFPGITLYLTAGHSYGTQSVTVNTKKGPFVICGDSAYTIENIETMTPMGYGFSQIEMLESFDKILKLAGGEINRIIPGHDLTWPDRYKSTSSISGKRNRVTVFTDTNFN